MEILTITSNDLGVQYGPSVHFLELWNEISQLEEPLKVEGLSPTWTCNPPIIPAKFNLRQLRVRGKGVRQFFWDVFCAAKILRSKHDIIYIRVASFHLFTCLVLMLVKAPIAVELNGSAHADSESRKETGLKPRIAAWCENYLIKRSCITFSVTEKLRVLAEQRNDHDQNHHIENGVGSQFSRASFVDTLKPLKQVIYVGTFTAWDGALKISEIARAFPDIEFLMIGDGGLRSDVEAQAPANMTFLGWQPYSALPGFYAKADAAIVLYEEKRHSSIGSSPLKLKEYMASGLPVFTTRADGTQLVEQLGIGQRCSSCSVEEFTNFVGDFPKYLERYKDISDELFEQFSWRYAARKTVSLLQVYLLKKGDPS